MSRYSDKVRSESGRGFSAEIRVEGLDQTLGVLRALEPEVYKRLNATIREAGKDVARQAATEFAMTGHGLGQYVVRRRSSGKKAGLSIYAQGKDEAIFEFAKEGHTPQGKALVSWLDRRFGKPGRFLWDTWDRQKFDFDQSLRSAMDEAEATVQSHLDAIGEGY